MTVAELIDRLKTFDPTMKVVLSKDEEGNGFSSAEDFSIEYAEKSWQGGRLEMDDMFILDDDDEDEDVDSDHSAAFQEVLVLWP